MSKWEPGFLVVAYLWLALAFVMLATVAQLERAGDPYAEEGPWPGTHAQSAELWCGPVGCFTQQEMEAGYRADAARAEVAR